MIRILDRYIGRDFLKLFALALTVLVAISILVNLFDRLHFYVEAGASAPNVVRYYVFRIPQEILQVAPIALLIASFLTVGRFKRNFELLAMQVARIHPLRAVLPIVILALAITAGLYVVQEEIAPQANETALWFRERIQSKDVNFHRTQDQDIWYLAESNRILHIGFLETRKSELHEVSLFQFSPDFVLVQRVEADKGRWEAGHWILSGVRIHRFTGGGGDMPVTEVPEMPLHVQATPADLARVEKKVEEMSSRELRQYIGRVSRGGEDARRYVADLLAKPAMLVVNFIMALLGIVIAFRVGRQGLVIHMGMCIAAAFLYWFLFSLVLPLARNAVFPPLLLLWFPNVIFGGIAFFGLLRPRLHM